MLTPSVSIVIPCYNARGTLPDTIASLRRQTLTDWEAICVDDASTDATWAYLADLMQNDARFHALRVPHGGLAATRNRGLAHVGAPRVIFLDADDVLAPTALEKFVTASRGAGDRAVVFSGVELLDQAGQPLDVYRVPSEAAFTPEALLTCNRFAPTALIPVQLLAERAYDESLPACEDWNLWLELAGRNVPAIVLPAPLLGYRLRTASLGHRADVMHAAGRRVLARWAGGVAAAERAGLLTRWSCTCAALAAAGGDAQAARRYLPDAEVLAADGQVAALAPALEWAWEYVNGARGETWRTHAGPWLSAITDWVHSVLDRPLAEQALAALRSRVAVDADLADRLRRTLRERPHKTRLLVYGLGTRGVDLLHRIRRCPELARLQIIAADDHATDGRFTALTLPRVDPRRWPRWPSDTFAIVTPDRPGPLQRTLAIAGGRAGHDYLALADLCPAKRGPAGSGAAAPAMAGTA